MFDINQDICDDHGDFSAELILEYMEELQELFEASPEGQKIQKQYGLLTWAYTMMDLGFNDLEITLTEMTDEDFTEILFDLIPEMDEITANDAQFIVDELHGFWSYLYRQYKLPNAPSKLNLLNETAVDELQDVLSDENHDEMTQKLIMLGTQNGFDMTTQEGLNQFMLAYSTGKLAQK